MTKVYKSPLDLNVKLKQNDVVIGEDGHIYILIFDPKHSHFGRRTKAGCDACCFCILHGSLPFCDLINHKIIQLKSQDGSKIPLCECFRAIDSNDLSEYYVSFKYIGKGGV